MKATKLIDAIEKLVKLADKEFYYGHRNLQLRFSSEDSTYVIGTKENDTIYLSVYFGSEIDFKFYLERDGTVLLNEGSTADLLEYYGPQYVISLIDNAGEPLLIFGTGAIEAGNYEFKTMEQVTQEFRQIRNPIKEKSEEH